MNVVVVDTSVWISYFQGKSLPNIDLALKEGRVYLAPLVIAELHSSISIKEKERAELNSFLEELPICATLFDHWIRVGELRGSLRRKGLNISTPDAHIAQCALDLDGYLATEDRIFSQLPKKGISLKLEV